MPTFRQVSFAGGELSPTLYGRSDLSKYAVGLRRMRNFFASRQGAAVSRPGTTFCGVVKNSAAGKVRLVPFIFSDTQTFVLEFGNLYVRFWQNGVPVMSGLSPYEVVTPYTTADLPKLKFAQTGSVLSLAHSAHPPAELTRVTDTNWTYAAITFDRPAVRATPTLLEPLPVADSSHPAKEWEWQMTELRKDSRGLLYETAPYTVTHQAIAFYAHWSSLITYAAGTKAVYVGDGLQYRSLVNGNLGHTPPSSGAQWALDAFTTSPTPYQQDALPTNEQGAVVVPVYPDKPVVVEMRSTDANALLATNDAFVAYRVYRGRGGLFGWVGDTKTTTFTDLGAEPDYSRQPPQGTNPFKFYDVSGTLTSTEYPSCVAFFEERRVFARTDNRPGFIFMSTTGDYSNFDERIVQEEDEALRFELASRRLEEIRSLTGWQKLIVGTNSSHWAVGGEGGPIAFDNLDAKVQTNVGTSWLDPLLVQGCLLFCRTKGVGVHALEQDVVRQSWADQDLTVLAEHLFVGHQAVAWAYAQDPWQLAYAVRDDGLLLTLTYVREHDVWAWSWHDTQGFYEDVCVVPEGNEDVPYFIVRRTVGGTTYRMLERGASRVVTAENFDEAVCLDAAVVSNVPDTVQVTCDHLAGLTVSMVVDGNAVAPFVTDGTINFDPPVQHVVVGLAYTPELETLDLAVPTSEVKTTDKLVTRAGFEVDNSAGLMLGENADKLKDWEQRRVSDNYDAVAPGSGIYRMPIAASWNTGGRLFLRQTAPKPVTVLSLIREVEFGSR